MRLSTTLASWVCWAITSLTSTAQGSRVDRHGSAARRESAPVAVPHSSTARPRARTCAGGRIALTASKLPPASRRNATRPRVIGRPFRSTPDVVPVGAAAHRGGGLLPDHDLPPEEAHFVATLVERLGLDRHHAAVVP